jgi:UDP-N-acetylmuramoylalanine--D-glutamate ligase
MEKLLLKNKKVLVMGLGLIGGGVSLIKWLVKQKAKITVTDLKTKNELKPSLRKLKNLPIKYVLGRHRKIDFKRADLIIKNPAVLNNSPYLEEARKNKIPIETDLSLFFNFFKGLVIGVTGTKGKSTTSTLIYEILKSAKKKVFLAGNIGKTPLNYLKNKKKIAVLEISSFQLENLTKSPQIAVITNIYPDHLDRYRNFKNYLEVKKNIFKYQNQKDFLILNYENKILKKIISEVPSNVVLFSKKEFKKWPKSELVVYVQKNKILLKRKNKKKIVCSIKDIKIIGEHNLENVLAAIAVSGLLNIKPKTIKIALKKIKKIPNRIELIRSFKGVKYYNDTTATNPEATVAALKTFKSKNKKIILIAGGSDKKLNYKKLTSLIKKKCKAVILLPGEASLKINRELKKIKQKIYLAKNMKIAVEIAKKTSKRGDIVLLSPASASFGLFKNEFDRGQQFIKEVKKLKK